MIFSRLLKITCTFLVAIFMCNVSLAQDKVIDQIVAIVGGNIILKSDIERMYIDQQAQGITSDGDMKCEILENFLVDKLLIAEAEQDTLIEVTDSQINQQMEDRLQMYIAHFGSEKAVEDYWGKPILQIKAELEEAIKNQSLSSQMQQKIVKDVTVTPSEVRYYFRNLNDDDIPVIPTQYEYAQITIEPEISLEEKNRVKAELREIKRKIEDGSSSFASQAILLSDDPSASTNGGELDYMGRAQLDPAYAAVAFNLKGDKISNVVESEFGYHIIQLIDRRGDKVKTRHILLKPKISIEAREQAYNRLDSLANMLRKGVVTFDEAAMMVSADKNTRNNGGLAINPATLSSKFASDDMDGDVSKVISKLKINEISDPFQTIDPRSNQTVYKIVKLVNKIEGHKANLQNDYQQLSEQYLAQKKENALKEWIKSKQSNTYIRIDDTYANCNFNFTDWIK